jgi:xylulose-5-phosphate/fructose-6-phosphate phosphoketolase
MCKARRCLSHLLTLFVNTTRGNINTPLELAIRNEADRFSLAILAIDNLKDRLGNKGGDVREKLIGERIRARNHA